MGNRFVSAARARPGQLGLWLSVATPDIVELLCLAGPDWMLVDLEHTALSLADAVDLDRAVAKRTEMLVRLPSGDAAGIKRALDAGFKTLLIPLVRTVDEAKSVISAGRYPPAGVRGVASYTRAASWGRDRTDLARLGDETAVILQIETAEAVKNIDEIAALEGLGGLFVGPTDLAANLGHFGNPDHPDVLDAIATTLKAARANRLAIGVFATQPERTERALAEGFDFVAIAQDAALLSGAATNIVDRFRVV